MTKFSEIAKDPHYDSAASGASRATIFVFIATFVYLLLFADASPGVLGGAAFFCIGIFAVSLVISMPLFLIRAKLPRFGSLVSIADIAATFFVTRAVYLWLFSVPIPSVAGQSFTCQEPLPEFTLGADSRPTEAEVVKLCACIWDNFGEWEKAAARAYSEGRSADVSSIHAQAFPSRFGRALKDCGGMDL
jgi:hypothetical protein